jgi:hypothetical protein
MKGYLLNEHSKSEAIKPLFGDLSSMFGKIDQNWEHLFKVGLAHDSILG